MSMLNLNLQNVEDLIFRNQKTHPILEQFQHLFYQWKLSQMSPALKSLGKKCAMELLNGLSERHIKALETYFGSDITLDRVDNHIIHNCVFEVNKVELGKVQGYPNFSVYRDREHAYICFWR
jgi:hypothetical protein